MGKKRNNILNPMAYGDDIIEFDVGEAGEEFAKVFGANKNLYRITPSLIDGLKPVQRRTLYAMKTHPKNGKLRKVSDISGDVMGRFHPHGNTSIDESIVTMSQPWVWNNPTITGHGNFGNVRGDSAAASRYIEAKLSAFGNKCFFTDIDKSNVPMRPSYNGDEKEPEYLPAAYPVVLINPQLSGIGYGMASNIPPFNFNEVVKATIKLMHDPNAKIMLIPDSPTGCDIVDTGLFKEINKTGKSKFTLRASYDIDYSNNIIAVTSLPMQVSVDMVVQKLIELRKKGVIDELLTVNDNTKKDEVNLHLVLKRDENPDKFIEKLMKKDTGLKKTYSCEIRVIDEYESKVYNPKKLLLTWIEYRKDCVRAIYNEKLISAMSEYHTNELYIYITEPENAQKAQQIIMKSKNKATAKEKLMKEFKITTLQAEAVAKLSMFDFTKERAQHFRERKGVLKKAIKEYEDVLNSDDAVDKIIEEQLTEGMKLFGHPRKSAIVKDGKTEEKIPNTMHYVGVSKDGFIKKILAEGNASIGYVGGTSNIIATLVNNRDNLLVFDQSGMISRISVSGLPDMSFDDSGVEISRYFKVNGDVVSMIRESDIKEHSDSNIVLVTENGYGKKTSLSEFKKIKSSTIAITLDDGDKLVSVIPSMDTDDFIVYTNFGDGIRLSTKDFKLYKKQARGLSLLSLKPNEKVVGNDLLFDGMKHLLYVTSAGRLKRTELKYFPVMKRKDEAISLIALEKGESLVGVAGVKRGDTLVCYRKKSSPVEIPIKDIKITSRVAKAEKMIKTPQGDKIIGYKIIRN